MASRTTWQSRGGSVPADPVSRDDLVAAWRKTFGAPPPKGVGMRLLALGLAYHEQVRKHGGLKPATRKQLAAIAAGKSDARTRSATSTSLGEGTRLVREWHGRTYIVDKVPDGFFYDGRTYRSLSQIARTITGARWSGPRFFGVAKS